MKNTAFYLILSFFIFSCGVKQTYNDSIPKHDNFTIESKNVNETRIINVWLPPNYENTNSFPELYMSDGGIKEDFPHIANTISQLVKSKKNTTYYPCRN